jgi:ribosomal protein L7/L12
LEENARPEVPPGNLEEQVLGLLRGRKKIEAVKLYREKTGAGLKQAVDAVEALAKEHNIISSRAGCAGVLLILVAAAVLILLKYAGAV